MWQEGVGECACVLFAMLPLYTFYNYIAITDRFHHGRKVKCGRDEMATSSSPHLTLYLIGPLHLSSFALSIPSSLNGSFSLENPHMQLFKMEVWEIFLQDSLIVFLTLYGIK